MIADTRGLQVDGLVADGQRDLVGGVGQRLVVADEGPGQDGDRTGEHALDRLVGQRLRVGDPFDRHRGRARDVAEEDRRAHTAGAVGLDPPVLRGGESVELFGEVLHHVVAFRFAVHEHVEPELLLQRDDVGDLVPHPRSRTRLGRSRRCAVPRGPCGSPGSAGTTRWWWWAARAGAADPAGGPAVLGGSRDGRRCPARPAGHACGRRESRIGCGDAPRPRVRRSSAATASRPAFSPVASTTSVIFSAPNASQVRSASSSSVSASSEYGTCSSEHDVETATGLRLPSSVARVPVPRPDRSRQTLRPSTTPATKSLSASSGTAATACSPPATRSSRCLRQGCWQGRAARRSTHRSRSRRKSQAGARSPPSAV